VAGSRADQGVFPEQLAEPEHAFLFAGAEVETDVLSQVLLPDRARNLCFFGSLSLAARIASSATRPSRFNSRKAFGTDGVASAISGRRSQAA
jgi:hypothetical protein